MFLAQIVDAIAGCDRAFAMDRAAAPGILFHDPRKKNQAVCQVDYCTMAAWPAVKKELKSLLPSLRKAAAFDFGRVQLAQKGDDYALPKLAPEAVDIFASGRIRLPAPICWFEFDLPPDRRIGLLVEEKEAFFEVREFASDLAVMTKDSPKATTYVMPPFSVRCRQPGRHPETEGDWATSDQGLEYSILDPFQALVAGSDEDIVTKALASGGVLRDVKEDDLFFAYLAMVLQSREKTVELVRPNAFANRRRSDKGLFPEPEFRRVSMAPGWSPGPAGSFDEPVGEATETEAGAC